MRLLFLGAAVFCGILIIMGSSMAFGKTVVLCSTFYGRLVTEDGAPASQIRVERTWEWGWTGQTGRDETQTDADGRFRFDEVTGKSWSVGLMPHEPSIPTRITAHGPSGPVLIFSVDKKTYDRDGELLGRGLTGPGIRLVCRIDAEPSDAGPFWGTCQPAN